MHSVRLPSIRELRRGRKEFQRNEPRDLFYRAASELVDLVIKRQSSLTLTEALAVLLQTWNKAYYQYRPFDDSHFRAIDKLVRRFEEQILDFREKSIVSLSKSDHKQVQRIFEAFEGVLGPVGASKALHLLAPYFFPLWDQKIARAYVGSLGARGENSSRYLRFMEMTCSHMKEIRGKLSPSENLLKLIDEYNYCKYTKGWVESQRNTC